MKFLVHKAFKDVYCQVLKTIPCPRYTKYKIMWINYGFDGTAPWLADSDPQWIEVKYSDQDWVSYQPTGGWHPGRV